MKKESKVASLNAVGILGYRGLTWIESPGTDMENRKGSVWTCKLE